MLKELPGSRWNRWTAAHLLKRAGFGASPDEWDQWTALGLHGAVNRLVEWQDQPPYGNNPPFATPDPGEEKSYQQFRNLPEVERRAKFQEKQREHRQQIQELRAWWLERMIHTTRPLEEKMTLFWHGHFVSSAQKVKSGYLMWKQNDLFRRLGNGNFQDLTVQVGRDPAMLIYLDGRENSAKAPNENYARELMELFTLGEGHYSEEDIRQAARALTGWQMRPFDHEAKFIDYRHDNGPKTFKNKTGPFTDKDIVALILGEDQAARFISQKLWTFFAYANPQPGLLDLLAETFRRGNYELKPLLRTMFLSEAFYSQDAVGTQIKSPVQWYVGLAKTARMLPLPTSDRFVLRALDLLGQNLLDPPSVKGWDGGRSWINTTTLLLRVNLSKFFVYGGNPQELGLGFDGKNIPPQALETLNPEEKQRLQRFASASKKGFKSPPFLSLKETLPPDTARRPEAAVERFYQCAAPQPVVAALHDYLNKLPSPDTLTYQAAQDTVYLLLSRPEYQLT